jgi:hypothetical protein
MKLINGKVRIEMLEMEVGGKKWGIVDKSGDLI